MFSQESKGPGNLARVAEHLMRDTCARVGCGVKPWQQKLSHMASWDGCFLADGAPTRALRGERHPAHEEVWKDGEVSSFPDILIKQGILPPWKAPRLGQHGLRS